MNKTGIKVETYKVYGKWYVDIQTEKDTYFAFIWRAGYGDKKMMFGSGKDQQSYDDFLDMVEANFEDYRSDYIESEIEEENVLEEERRFWTADREAGNRIECFCTLEEAEEAIANYETDDAYDGTYEPNFYEIEFETDDGEFIAID